MVKAYLNWSSGKDAAYALYLLQKEKKLEVGKLVTTINTEVNRISMHGVRLSLLQTQAESLQLPLHIISLDGNVSMDEYNAVMQTSIDLLKAEGFTHSIFGDIFLEDLRSYREEQLQKVGMKALFPLWKINTCQLIREFIAAGFKAITVCVNAKLLDESFCGRIIDQQFLDDLPSHIDPCGENGEFHSFVFDGPNFNYPVEFEIGEKIKRSFVQKEKKVDNCFSSKDTSWDTHFWYCDLIPQIV